VAELMEFPEIPIKVSLNEYIEIAKYYSTPNSSVFINGVLDRIVEELKQEKMLVKEEEKLV
jgi:N utilization substance protein B